MMVVLNVQSCAKDGSPGEDGIDGTSGVDGADGTKIYSGSADPTNATGAIGDFYINMNSGLLFGPKAESGWGIGFKLKATDGKDGTNGKDGINGKDGATVLNGFGVPQDNLGKNGDFYINTETLVLFGPKSADGWGNGISLRNDEYYGVKSYKVQVKFNKYPIGQTYRETHPDVHLESESYNMPYLNSSTILGVYVSYGGVFGLLRDLPSQIYDPHKIDSENCAPCWIELNNYDQLTYGKYIRLSTRAGIGNVGFQYGPSGLGIGAGNTNDAIYFRLQGYTYQPIFPDDAPEISGPMEPDFNFLERDITVGIMVKYMLEKEYEILAKQHPDVERFLRMPAGDKVLNISK
ncbi:hypothetical protein M8998_02600 [Sphingobacterium sp. lm-10]|uniref:hypothetical protein n=1 Tax=Sphingobacterium sp. lm-10 TaxID=2944904 RepID=UPI002021BE36|nr:hypothetical protein [Sphingobacterium sp. lm-10]MCL7986824.1 hypothetical protein [Sphingobacterium sp. lm-10]